ncbi:hypothetical protein FACS189493_6090 [Spirochaetia bacterium]|nr:hypothetical protein FACS189493_6090 [Spirochaetia bacterium]
MNNKIILILICVCFPVTACTTINVKDSSSLSPKRSEAFLFATITTNVPNLTINIYQRNRDTAGDSFARASAVIKLRSGYNLVMIKLPAGYYTFKYVYPEDTIDFFELRDIVFKLDDNVINYDYQDVSTRFL